MLIAYPNGEAQKSAVVAEMQGHAEADRLVQNYGYWEVGKGCAVGCLIKSGNHAEYEPRFGIPQALAQLEDTIFENLPEKEAIAWPVRFLSAPKVGADLSLVQWQFLEFVVGEALSRAEAESVRDACQPALDIVAAAARGEVIDASAAASAASAAIAARNAASAAASVAWRAARSAAGAARSVESAARNAASAAASVAWRAAWSAAGVAASAESAAGSAGSAAWTSYSEKLIELMAAAPVTSQVPA